MLVETKTVCGGSHSGNGWKRSGHQVGKGLQLGKGKEQEEAEVAGGDGEGSGTGQAEQLGWNGFPTGWVAVQEKEGPEFEADLARVDDGREAPDFTAGRQPSLPPAGGGPPNVGRAGSRVHSQASGRRQ